MDNARLYQQAERLAVVEERQRLARELHDSVTQSLYSSTLLTEVARRSATARNLVHSPPQAASFEVVAVLAGDLARLAAGAYGGVYKEGRSLWLRHGAFSTWTMTVAALPRRRTVSIARWSGR